MPPKRRSDLCAVCNKAIVDGRDEALFCEGKCQAWLHRCCASVSSEQHKLLTASTEPFFCPTCGQEHNQAQIAELKNTVEALKFELSQLKKAFSDLQDRAAHPTSINSKSYAAAAAETRPTKRRPSAARNKSKPTHQSSSHPVSTPSQPGNVPDVSNNAARNSAVQGNRVKVEGARRIWGTVKSCTVGTVRGVIQRFCKIESGLRVRRKISKPSSDSNRIRWWFVLHGDETLLTSLESRWEAVNMQTSWKLQPCFMPSELPPGPHVNVSEPSGLSASNDIPQSPQLLHDPSSHSDHFLGELVEDHPPTQIQSQ